MQSFFSILLMIHLAALVVGGATNVAMPLLGRQMREAPPEAAARFAQVGQRLRLNSQVALAVLVVSGVAMMWLRYDGNVGALGPWFIAKLGLVALMIALLGAGALVRSGRVSPALFGVVTRVSLIAIIVCSVMAFG